MSEYYVGQKLLCISDYHVGPNQVFTKGIIYELGEKRFEILYEIIDDEGIDHAGNWDTEIITELFIDATKYISEQDFNTKFDDWLNE